MVTLAAAFDASVDKTRNWLAVAGFISSAKDWVDFDRAWRARLAEDGLAYFHMVDFAHSREEFTVGWRDDEPRRRRLLGDLLKIIQNHVYHKVGFMIEVTGYEDRIALANKEYFAATAFAVAGKVAVAGAFSWCLENFKKAPRIFFEHGDAASGSLDAALRPYGIRPRYEYKKDNEKTGELAFSPLHAADMLAYEMTKMASVEYVPGQPLRFRHPYDVFERITGQLLFMSDTNLDALDGLLSGFKTLNPNEHF